MIEINYSPYWDGKKGKPNNGKGDIIPKNIFDLIVKKDTHFDINMDGKFKIRKVESPFILADNEFDLHEANNNLIEIGVKRNKVVEFTGGAFYIEFVKDGEGIILHGNEEEGYNIFLLI